MKRESVAEFGDASGYEGYIGRWSRPVAQQFIEWLGVAPELSWLDIGTGTGMLAQVILEQAAPANIVGIDPSQEYIAFARQNVEDERVEFRVGTAGDLSAGQSKFEVAVAGLVLNFMPSAEDALQSLVQVVGAGGTLAAYVWDYAEGMQIMRQFWDAAIAIDPPAAELDSGKRFTICNPDKLQALFEGLGLTDVEVTAIDIQADFVDFDDYWLPFLAAQGSVSKYLGSLDDEGKAALREQLLSQLPIDDDGSIHLVTRAWAVKGIR